MAWEHTFKFDADTDGWRAQRPGPWPGTSGTWDKRGGRWVNGCSFNHAATILDRSITLPPNCELKRVQWEGGVAGGGLSYLGIYINYHWKPSSPIINGNVIRGDYDLTPFNLTSPQTLTLSVELDAGGCWASSFIDSVRITGDGENPFLYAINADRMLFYRAPITGNPIDGELNYFIAGQYRYLADLRFQDHVGQWWIRVVRIEQSGTLYEDVHLNAAIAAGKGGLWIPVNAPTTEPDSSRFNSLPISTVYTISDVAWNSFTGVFEQWPVDIGVMCDAATTPREIHALGIGGEGVGYPRDTHSGVDLFVPNALENVAVKSMSVGMVVGIGFGNQTMTTHAVWGSTSQTDDQGGIDENAYCVIIRHGHLYTLYGHLAAISDDIWVGCRVEAGTFLGTLGRFYDRHVHVEVHSYGATIASGILPEDAVRIGPTGILPVGLTASQIVAPYLYDLMQLLSDPLGYAGGASLRNLVATGNLDEVTVGGQVEGQVNLPLRAGCNLLYRTRYPTQDSILTISAEGFRGFIAYGETNRLFPSPLTQTVQP